MNQLKYLYLPLLNHKCCNHAGRRFLLSNCMLLQVGFCPFLHYFICTWKYFKYRMKYFRYRSGSCLVFLCTFPYRKGECHCNTCSFSRVQGFCSCTLFPATFLELFLGLYVIFFFSHLKLQTSCAIFEVISVMDVTHSSLSLGDKTPSALKLLSVV